MDDHHDVVTVTRVSESSDFFGVPGVDETLGGNLGFEEDEGDEIMVEVVGSDLFFDGVGGNEIGGDARDMEMVMGDSGTREARIGTVGGGFEDEGTSGDHLVDVVANKHDIMVNENVVGDDVIEDVKFVVNGDGLERRDEVTRNGDMSCVLTTLSAREASFMHDVVMSRESEVSAGDSLVATGFLSGKTEGDTAKMTYCSNEENMKQTVEPFDSLASQIGVVGDEASNDVTDSGNTCIIPEFVDQETEDVGRENEMVNREESLPSGPDIAKTGVHGRNLQHSAEGLMKKNMIAENAGAYADLGVDTVSCHKPADLLVDSKVANDDHKVSSDKVFETAGTVGFSEGKGYDGEGTQTFVSEGVTSNEVLNLAFKSSDNKPIIGSLVENMGSCITEEGKSSQGGQLEGDISLTYEISCLDSNVEGIYGDFDLQFSECLDSSGIFSGISSDPDHILEGEEENNDAEQNDVRKDKEMEVEDEAMNIEQSEAIDEKISDQVSPRSGSSISEFHSRYLLPPKTEGEFYVSDLVWGKVRNHPWWPGQILNPADASEKAMKYHKKESFLVAYFGDRTSARTDACLLRSFRTHFSEIEKQRNTEAFHRAVSGALAEVSRRVELGLSCSCIANNSHAETKSQILERTEINQEAGRRYSMDESIAASSFEPEELLEHIRSLALFPSGGVDDRLQLVISKAQLSTFSRFRGQRPMPEFMLGGGLMENDANTSKYCKILQEDSEQIRGENKTCSKRRRDVTDSLLPRKKERSMSELICDMSNCSDSEVELDSNRVDKSVASSAGRKRKALDSVTDGSDKRQSYYAAKVSSTASQTPNPSFKVGECMRRVASQLNGSSSLVKCTNEKFLKVDGSVDQQPGFDCSPQSPMYSQRGMMMLLLEHSSLDEMLSHLHLAALNPTKKYSFLNNVSTFFSDFRKSVTLGQSSRRQNSSVARGGSKKKPPHAIINSPEDFEFDDVNDSYWTDRRVQNHGEEQLLNSAQDGEAERPLVPYEDDWKKVDKPLKSSQRSRKRFSSREHLMVTEEPVSEHTDSRRPDCSPTELILKFTEGNSIPSELNLNKIFKRFGPLREPETEVDRETSRAKVVYKRCSDAEVAFSSAGKFNIFGPIPVSFELSYVPSASFKTLSAATLQDQQDAS